MRDWKEGRRNWGISPEKIGMKNLKIRTKLLLMGFIMVAGVSIISILGILMLGRMNEHSLNTLEQNIRQNFDDFSKSQVVNAASMLDVVYSHYEEGQYSLEEAKKLGADYLRNMRYQEGGYFWADTLEGVNVVLLGNETEGTDRSQSEDSYGNKYIQNFIQIAKTDGEGFTDYYFPREGEAEASPKRAFVKYYEPFGWVIGTGNYTDDIDDKVAAEKAVMTEERNKILRTVMMTSLAAILLLLLVAVPTIVRITIDFNMLRNGLSRLAAGDFTYQIPEKYLSRKDDFGIVGRAVNDMVHSVGGVLGQVKQESDQILAMVTDMTQNITNLNQDIENVSATTQELAAGMEETSASSQEMAAVTQEVKSSTVSLAESSQESAREADEIGSRAEKTKEVTVESQRKAKRIKAEIDEQLNAALDRVKVIDQIEVLADAIMGITDQTNLLALNASIEAARAGEAGKGFAVVANEIGQLANQSKDTATQIQGITEEVTKAVQNLSENARKLLDFVSVDVTRDYEVFMEVSKQYVKDALFVEQLVNQFSKNAVELQKMSGSMAESVKSIALTASEGAIGTSEIAGRNQDIQQSASGIMEMVQKTEESAAILDASMKKFTI